MEQSNFNLPTPQMLIKKAKEETIPVSLRVKESTVAIFDKMAKEAGVNRGAMMNTWLDFYAQSQNTSNDDSSKDIMISFLNSERFWNKIPSLTPEELIYRIPSLCGKKFYLNGTEDARELFDEYTERVTDGDALVAFIKEDGIIASDGEPSCYTTPGMGTTLHVPLEQWPLVTVLLGEYVKKFDRLFPERDYAITPSMYSKIAQACKMHAKPDGILATDIKEILRDYVEKQND